MEAANFEFVFIANNLAIDFVNTQLYQRGALVDLLQTEMDLANWLQAAGLTLNEPIQSTDLAAAKRLRLALQALCHARMAAQPPQQQDVARINRHLTQHASYQTLQIQQGQLRLVADKAAFSFNALLAQIAYAGAELLSSAQAARLKRCGNPDCVLLFVDLSRAQKRRWCSMDSCGNRAKVAKHYQTHYTQGSDNN